LTGRRAFSASSETIVSVAVSTFAAEAAADGAADELQLVQRPLEVRGDDAHREVHRLCARVDDQTPARLGDGQRDLGLHRAVLDRLRPVDALDDEVRLVERRVDVALADAAVVVGTEVRIDRAPLVEVVDAGVRRAADVEDRFALLEDDLDRVDAGLRGLLGLGRHGGDRLALPADVVLGEQRLVGGDAETLEVAVDVVRHALRRHHGVHARERLGLARVHAADQRAVVRRAQRLAPQRAVDADVVDVLRAARDVGDAVVAGESGADGLHDAATASTIFT
jgi:hypothetical protein